MNARFTYRAAAGLVLLVLLVFGVTLGGGFVGDDRFMIVKNPYVQDPALWSKLVTDDTWAGSGGATTNYRPLPMLSFAVNYRLGGLEPFGYHLVNLGLHAAVVLLVFAVGGAIGLSKRGALVGASLFAIHPIQTEAVSGIFGRMDLMAGLFFLGALWAHVVAGTRAAAGRTAPGLRCVAVACFVGAVLSKENAVVFPAVALAYDGLWGRLSRRSSWKPHIVHGGVALAYLALWWSMFSADAGGISAMDNTLAQVDAPRRIVSALAVAGLYLRHLVVPIGLSPDYTYRVILPVASVLSAAAAWALLGASLVLAAAVRLGRRSRVAAIALWLSFLTFLPVSNLVVPIGTAMGDRLLYLPMAGVGLLFGLLRDRLSVRSGTATGLLRARWVLVAVLVLFSALSFRLARFWTDEFTLLRHAVTVTPESAKLRNNLGFEYLDRDRREEAEQQFQASLEIAPEYYQPLQGLALIAQRDGDPERALRYAQAAADLAPDPSELLGLIGTIQQQRGRLELARDAWTRALALRPDHPQTLSNLGILEWQAGHRQLALDYWRRATGQPDAPAAIWLNLARAYDELGDRQAAERMRREYDARHGAPLTP